MNSIDDHFEQTPHCLHENKLQYRTKDDKYYCCLKAVNCPYYKTERKNDYCTARYPNEQ